MRFEAGVRVREVGAMDRRAVHDGIEAVGLATESELAEVRGRACRGSGEQESGQDAAGEECNRMGATRTCGVLRRSVHVVVCPVDFAAAY